VNVTGTGEPERVPALGVTDGALPLLGVTPLLGRFFTREDDSPGSAETVILTYSYWSRKFGGACP
jgi:putative ABC transport system permease protein